MNNEARVRESQKFYLIGCIDGNTSMSFDILTTRETPAQFTSKVLTTAV